VTCWEERLEKESLGYSVLITEEWRRRGGMLFIDMRRVYGVKDIDMKKPDHWYSMNSSFRCHAPSTVLLQHTLWSCLSAHTY